MTHKLAEVLKLLGIDEDEFARDLAKAEHLMDIGKAKHVVYNGHRLAVIDEVFTEMELVNGQTINGYLFEVILRKQIAFAEMRATLEKVQKATAPKKHSDDCKSFGIRGECPACLAKAVTK